MCRTTVTYLPRCPPTPDNPDHQTRSAELLENLGDLESWKGNPEESFAYLNEAMVLYRAAADTRGVASVLRKQAAAAYRHSDYDEVLKTASTSLEHFRNLNDPLGIADASFWLGCSFFMTDKEDEALPILRESLEIYRTHGNEVGAAQCLERIGEIQRFNSQTETALSTLEEAVAVASRSGDRLGVARALTTIGVTHCDRSNFVRATDALSEASTIARNIGWDPCLANALRKWGALRARWGLARALEDLGECFRTQSNLDDAAPLLEESCLLYQALSQQQDSLAIASNLTQLRSSQSQWGSALFWCDHIIAAHRGQSDQWSFADSLERKGKILVKAERYEEAALHFEAAIVIRSERGDYGGWVVESLSAILKTVIKGEQRSPLLTDMKRLQRRLPQLVTASLKLPIACGHRNA